MTAQAIKLYEEAMEFAYETIGKEHAHTAYFQGAIAGKLIELVAKECINQIPKDMHFYDYNRAVDNISQHFGVTE